MIGFGQGAYMRAAGVTKRKTSCSAYILSTLVHNTHVHVHINTAKNCTLYDVSVPCSCTLIPTVQQHGKYISGADLVVKTLFAPFGTYLVSPVGLLLLPS